MIPTFALDFVKDADEHALRQVLTEHQIQLDEYNKMILKKYLERAITMTQEFWGLFVNDFRKAVEQVEEGIQMMSKSTKQAVDKQIHGSINLVIKEILL